jgi:hypothetical protein
MNFVIGTDPLPQVNARIVAERKEKKRTSDVKAEEQKMTLLAWDAVQDAEVATHF